jgi:8-oxo-dGTP diphosphatase
MLRVSAALVTHNHKILLFHRDNNPDIVDPDKWSLIGGHVEEGETYDEALLRELEEEISVRPSQYHFLFKWVGHREEHLHFYHVPLSDEEASRIKLGDEGQEVRFFTFDEMESVPKTHNLTTQFEDKKEFIRNLLSENSQN